MSEYGYLPGRLLVTVDGKEVEVAQVNVPIVAFRNRDPLRIHAEIPTNRDTIQENIYQQEGNTMSTIEDFKNAPVGATATSRKGNIALKTGRRTFEWSIYDSLGNHCNTLSSDEMVDHEKGDFTLNHVVPNTAHEVLELVWELAHPVKEGQVIPVGAWVVARRVDGITVDKNAFFDITVNDWDAENRRTLDPLPEPEPEWLDAPAVLASYPLCADTEQIGIWLPSNEKGKWEWPLQDGEFMAHWSELEEVTPLYPKDEA